MTDWQINLFFKDLKRDPEPIDLVTISIELWLYADRNQIRQRNQEPVIDMIRDALGAGKNNINNALGAVGR